MVGLSYRFRFADEKIPSAEKSPRTGVTPWYHLCSVQCTLMICRHIAPVTGGPATAYCEFSGVLSGGSRHRSALSRTKRQFSAPEGDAYRFPVNAFRHMTYMP